MKIGDKLKDNDVCMGPRILTIADLGPHHVYCNVGKRSVRISRDRIHDDGKPRKSGFDLIVT